MSSTITPQKTEMNLKIPVSYHFHNVPDSKKLVILLHGYTDSAQSFYKRAFTDQNTDFNILAANAPYPMPVKTLSGYKEKYAWYFSDPRTGFVLIKPEVSVRYLKQLVNDLGLNSHEKTLVGFSQGGFLAPHVAKEVPNVKKIIGVGCAFRTKDYEGLEGFNVDAIHGTEDEIISLELSKSSYEQVTAERNIKGTHFEVPNLKHSMNVESREILMKNLW